MQMERKTKRFRDRCRQIEVEIGKRRTDGEIDRRGRRETDRQKTREMQKEKAKMEKTQ
jgi:hypothetical protein